MPLLPEGRPAHLPHITAPAGPRFTGTTGDSPSSSRDQASGAEAGRGGWGHDCTRERQRAPPTGRRRGPRRAAGRRPRPAPRRRRRRRSARCRRDGGAAGEGHADRHDDQAAAGGGPGGSLDDASRNRLRDIHAASIRELEDGLSPELREELERITLPFTEGETPSDAELRIAQAQLVGWLEGVFHGIQTAIFAQQMAARAQLEEVRRKALPGGSAPGGQQPDFRPGGGQYL
ncbi:proteasome activator [Blastococcus brunescens]|uniref:Bacterial proteasome activator n=1 Tax=Blastococcus brunescens TaxID=1564165 RepID=A0ABZ1AZY1_9ACTN|nr:proteasome activator [Blastococcus sp. BMG 8361]WRL64123.1 proteasome activator [Blastococcus sp. BMG 8361]